MSLAREGKTSDPYLRPILQSRAINHALGGPFVGPWDIDLIDDVTLEACLALTHDLRGMQAGQKKVEDAFAKFRRNHPTYRK